jgi:hypothetical protein
MEVDDAEPAHSDRAAAIQMKTLIIRSPMANRVAHSPHVRKPGGSVTEEKTGYAAHLRPFYSSRLSLLARLCVSPRAPARSASECSAELASTLGIVFVRAW